LSSTCRVLYLQLKRRLHELAAEIILFHGSLVSGVRSG
jgi:hypothetical protein